jgi:UDP-N-acetylglucosamine acyltransferase
MALLLHPTAIIDPEAELGNGVTVGPFAVIEGDVVIGDGTSLGPHTVVYNGTRLGKDCRIFQGAGLGQIPQDLKFKGEETVLRIGDRAIIREFCTMNRGTAARGETVIGNDCTFLAYCHVGHDCVIGDGVIVSNNLAMAGHVEVGNNVTIGGVCAIHQFVRIGDCAMIQVQSYVTQDVVPYALVGADPLRISGVNKVKLERLGYSPERCQTIKRAYRTLFREGLNLKDAIATLEETCPGDTDILLLTKFLRESSRGIVRMESGGGESFSN